MKNNLFVEQTYQIGSINEEEESEDDEEQDQKNKQSQPTPKNKEELQQERKTKMINKESYLNSQQDLSPFDKEEGEGTKKFALHKKQTLKQNVETIIIEERKKEEEEQQMLITQILEIEDFILKNDSMIDFRQGMKKKISLFTIFILILIAERILYTSLIDEEQTLMQKMQEKLDVSFIPDQQVYSQYSTNFFWKFINFGVGFHDSFLLCTAFFATVFSSVSDFVGIKLIFTSLIGIYCIGVLQLFYDGPLPYWTSDQISAPVCVQTGAHPSRFVFTVLFISYYFLYCLKFRIQRNQRKSEAEKQRLYKKVRIIQIILAILFLPYFFVVYLSGLQFIINIALGFIMFTFYYNMITQSNFFISESLAKVSIDTESAKKSIFKWFINIIVLIFAAFIVLLACKRFIDINWIGNYLNCTQESQNYFINDQLVGPYHTFSIVTVLGGLAGAIFGWNHTYNHLSQSCVKTWYKGTILKRVLRALIVNIFMIPSWVLISYQESLLKNEYIINLGFTEFLLDMFHFFFLYLLLFGFLPVYIFQPLKLVHYKKQKKQDRSITFLNPSTVGQ